MRSLIILIALIAWLPVNSQTNNVELIQTGPGPEDMVLDKSQSYPRLILSTSSRRVEYGKHGEIEEYNLATRKHRILPRFGEPAGLEFFPHGICLSKIGDKNYLYVISHYKTSNNHPVIRYILEADKLVFDQIFEHKLLVSPNAVTAFSDGSFLVCNDLKKRDNRIEQILGLKKANILFFDSHGECKIAADKLGLPAGMNHIENQVYVACATENRVYSFELRNGSLTNKKVLAKVKGPDNIRISEDGLWVPCHVKTMAFVRHMSKPKIFSPSTVYKINPESGISQLIYQDDGSTISAASVALPYDGSLFVGQIFESFLLKTKIPKHLVYSDIKY